MLLCFHITITRTASLCCVFFFNDTATTEIYTLSLHDALPIFEEGASLRRGDRAPTHAGAGSGWRGRCGCPARPPEKRFRPSDRKSTRLNSSHANISYAVFCLKKKNKFPAT